MTARAKRRVAGLVRAALRGPWRVTRALTDRVPAPVLLSLVAAITVAFASLPASAAVTSEDGAIGTLTGKQFSQSVAADWNRAAKGRTVMLVDSCVAQGHGSLYDCKALIYMPGKAYRCFDALIEANGNVPYMDWVTCPLKAIRIALSAQNRARLAA